MPKHMNQTRISKTVFLKNLITLRNSQEEENNFLVIIN